MAKYVLAYTGGGDMAGAPEEQQKLMEAWMTWLGSLGASAVDAGNPFGAACTIASSGSVSEGGASALTGYSVIEAEGMTDAAAKAKGCPVLANGGAIEVYEALPIG
jgi:hypothetical protein